MKRISKPKWSVVTILFALLAVSGFLYFSGCVAIPDHVYVVKGTGGRTTAHLSVDSCDVIGTERQANRPQSALNPDGFSLFSWNSHKGSDYGFLDDLQASGLDADLLLLQEVAFDEKLTETLDEFTKEWLLAVAFRSNNTDIGVMTLSSVSPGSSCAFSEPEPLLVIPKVILVGTYPIAGSDKDLLVVNVHLVNFTLNSDVLQRQIAAVTGLIEWHQGPVIVAGDFNTWNSDRELVIQEEMKRLGLQQVRFDPDNRTVFFTHTVDGIFFRGLEVVQTESLMVQSSDHNPLAVTFRLLDNS